MKFIKTFESFQLNEGKGRIKIDNGNHVVMDKLPIANDKDEQLIGGFDPKAYSLDPNNSYNYITNIEELKEKEIEDLVKKHKEKLDYKTGMVE